MKVRRVIHTICHDEESRLVLLFYDGDDGNLLIERSC